jgi:hypothetical protein
MKLQVQGIFNYYTFNGGDVWGLKKYVGDDPAISPKWRGYMQWLSTVRAVQPIAFKIGPIRSPGVSILFNLLGQQAEAFGVRGNLSTNRHGLFITMQDNSSGKPVLMVR